MNVGQLKQDVDFLCGSTSGTYPDTDKLRNMNIAYQDVARIIWESDGSWQYDDSNATTLPNAKTTIVHNQQDYSLPSTTQRLEAVNVKDKTGNWHKLQQFDIHDTNMALPEFMDGIGMPMYYDLVGRSIMLYPTPSSAAVTLASGMAVYVSRDVTELVASATSSSPGFATAFHRILSYSAAMDFVQDSAERQLLAVQKDRLERGLVRFYGKRNVSVQSAFKPRTKKNWRQYT